MIQKTFRLISKDPEKPDEVLVISTHYDHVGVKSKCSTMVLMI
jgi:L-ascorbate metabolism protein UlaG (beta-lactamase superfamily)